jgi:nucleotide-binding universal stress UspA family protein
MMQDLHTDEVQVMKTHGLTRLTHPEAILVATNLSDLHRLMPFALQMAGETGARLELLHVLPFSAEFNADITGMPYYDREGALSCANNMLDPWCKRAQKLGIRCTAIVRENEPAAGGIVEAIRQFHPDRLLLGTRSLGRLGKLILGSVAEQVLRSVNLPIFTVGPEAHLPPENSGRQPTVIFATDLGEGYEANAALACQLAATMRAKMIMLHVLPPMFEERCANQSNILFSTILYEMDQLARKLAHEYGTEVDIKVAHGEAAPQIQAEAAACEADLIVMGTAEHTMLDNIAHDRTTCRVLAHARCPVLSLHGYAGKRMEHHDEAMAVH